MNMQQNSKMLLRIPLLLFLLGAMFSIQAQRGVIPDSLKAIQLSGMVVTEERGEIIPLPYVNIYVKGTTRGTFTGNDGFFSMIFSHRCLKKTGDLHAL